MIHRLDKGWHPPSSGRHQTCRGLSQTIALGGLQDCIRKLVRRNTCAPKYFLFPSTKARPRWHKCCDRAFVLSSPPATLAHEPFRKASLTRGPLIFLACGFYAPLGLPALVCIDCRQIRQWRWRYPSTPNPQTQSWPHATVDLGRELRR